MMARRLEWAWSVSGSRRPARNFSVSFTGACSLLSAGDVQIQRRVLPSFLSSVMPLVSCDLYIFFYLFVCMIIVVF